MSDNATQTENVPTKSAGSLTAECDWRCPRFTSKWYCCMGCCKSRRAFKEAAGPDVQRLWTEGTGFWDPQRGCRLERTQRPSECLEYDCADQMFLIGVARDEKGWPMVIRELPRATATADQAADAMRGIWAEMHARGILTGSGPAPSQSSFDRAMGHIDGPTVFLMHGMMGSGKSTWAKRFCERHPRARIVSADAFRAMVHGRYMYLDEMYATIENAMRDTAVRLLAEGYDVVIDCGNLTRERRKPWLTLSKKTVAIVLPRMHKDWHVGRRAAKPHRTTDWGKVYDGEKAALEPVEACGEPYAEVIFVPATEVSGRKILILTASPVRDKHIDDLIASKLRALGHEVEVSPCLRGGREKVLEFQPDLCLVPPIRNPNSRDFVEELKRFGCAVVTRHTEPSCSWQDWKKMPQGAKQEILGAVPYDVDLELVWSQDEADILNRRGVAFKAIPIGAIGLDIYFDKALLCRHSDRAAFMQHYHFAPDKPTVLISSSWGFADSSPDLGTEEIQAAQRDTAGRDRYLAMIRAVHASLKDSWNILITIHHGIDASPYRVVCDELRLPLEAGRSMIEMLPHVDVLVHAGSTAAVSAHLLNIPAVQFGDVNAQGSTNWWGVGESAISRVSPSSADNHEQLIGMISIARGGGSNANMDVIRELEQGRYGVIDGKACDRLVEHILNLPGAFRMKWPRSIRDYRQPTVMQTEGEFFKTALCGVCKQSFAYLTDEYLAKLCQFAKIDPQILRPKGSICCPHCGARLFTT